jgi:hypothetical protein
MPEKDIVLDTLEERYFDLCREENIGQTPKLTEKIDKLESRIREIRAAQPKEEVCAN